MSSKRWKNESVLKLIEETSNDDAISAIREKTRNLVLNAFEKGWSGPPFNPVELARLLNINVVPNDSIQSARIIPFGTNKFTIEYNPYEKPTRINFSISHEIGHFLFPDCNNSIRNREENKDTENWELEFLCDIAASEILLPYAEFAREANSVELNLRSLLNISNKYQASLEAVFLRFAEVINKPCGIVMAAFGGDDSKNLYVDYFKSSGTSWLKIPQKYKIPANSKAYECINSGWTSEGLERWDVFSNSKFKIYSIGLPPLKKHKHQRVGIFLVPETSDNTVENTIYTVNGDATAPRGKGNKIIAQVINSTGGLGFGFGRAMSLKWPDSKKAVNEWIKNKSKFQLGESKLTSLSNDTYVFQMLAQKGIRPKEGETALSYVSLKKCLENLAVEALNLDASVHMPQIGAGQAKGDWNIIEGMIYDTLVQKGINVTIYVLPGTNYTPKNKSTLTLFDYNSIYEKQQTSSSS